MRNHETEIHPVPDDWILQLATAIAEALREFSTQLGNESLAMLAVDCHPWHGSIGLSALTATEATEQSFLTDPSEMAAWRYFHFADDMVSWQVVVELDQFMKSSYDTGDRPAVTDAFMRACAEAISSDVVDTALAAIILTDGFRLSVAHPDTGREFVGAS